MAIREEWIRSIWLQPLVAWRTGGRMVWSYEFTAEGSRSWPHRLAIIDIEGSQQSISWADGRFTIVFN